MKFAHLDDGISNGYPLAMKVLVTIPDELVRDLDLAAGRAGVNRSRFIVEALQRHLQGGNGRRPIDDPKLRAALERMRAGKYGLGGSIDTAAMIRRMRDRRRAR